MGQIIWERHANESSGRDFQSTFLDKSSLVGLEQISSVSAQPDPLRRLQRGRHKADLKRLTISQRHLPGRWSTQVERINLWTSAAGTLEQDDQPVGGSYIGFRVPRGLRGCRSDLPWWCLFRASQPSGEAHKLMLPPVACASTARDLTRLPHLKRGQDV